MTPSLLFHSDITTYPSEPDSFLAVVRLPKSASLDSIVITPLGLKPFYYHKPSSNLEHGQTSTRPTEIDLFFNARYPPPLPTEPTITSALPSDPPTKAPKGWKPNSLHKTTLSYNPHLSSSGVAPLGTGSPSTLAIQQFDIGMPLDVSTTLVVLRCPFSVITLSLYGYPSTALSAVPDHKEPSPTGWEAFLSTQSAQPIFNLPNNSFESVLLSVAGARSDYLDGVMHRDLEEDDQNEESMAVDGLMSKEKTNHPLQERLNEILKNLTHLIKCLEQSTLHTKDVLDCSSEDTCPAPSSSSSVSPEACIELILLNLDHLSEILEFLTRQPSSSAGLQALLSSIPLDVPVHAIFQLLNRSSLAHWNKALAISAQTWIDLLKIPCIAERLVCAFAVTPNHSRSRYKDFYDLSSWRKILYDPDSDHNSSADRTDIHYLSQDLLRSYASCDVHRTSRLSREVQGDITPNGLFSFIEKCISVGLVCTRISLLKEGDRCEAVAVELGWLVRWMGQQEWENICTHFLTQPLTFSVLLHLTTPGPSLDPSARKIVESLLISPVVSTSPCILYSLQLLRLFASSLPQPSPPLSSSSSPPKGHPALTLTERLQTAIDCTEYTISNVSFEHFLSRFVHLAQSIPTSPKSNIIFQAHLYLLQAHRSFPEFPRRSMPSDRLTSRSFWIFYLDLVIELYESLTICFWNGIENLVQTPPFVRFSHFVHQDPSVENPGETVNMLGALGELGARLMSLIGCILKVITQNLLPSSHPQSFTPSSGRPEVDCLIETRTTDLIIVRATRSAISTFTRAELFSTLLSTNRKDVGLIDPEAERLKIGLDLSKITSLGVLDQLTSFTGSYEDGTETRHEDEERRLGLVIRTVLDYGLEAGSEKSRKVVVTVIAGLIPGPLPSPPCPSPISEPSLARWKSWDRILHENCIQLTFFILNLNLTSPSTQSFLDKVRLFRSLFIKLSELPPLASSSLTSSEDTVDIGVGAVDNISATSILGWMFASPTSSLDKATGPVSQLTPVCTSNPVNGSISSTTSMVPTAATMTVISSTATTPTAAPATSIAATVGGSLSVPIQRTSKTYRQNEFRSSRSSTLTLPPGVSLMVSPGPSGAPIGANSSLGGGLGVGTIGSGGAISKMNASRAPSKHVDEFELEIELESQRKRTEGSREIN